MPELTIEVGESAAGGVRLDRYCASLPGAISRSRLKNGAIGISVNGKAAKLSRVVVPGDSIRVSWEDPIPEDLNPEDIPLDILFENPDVTVINKRQGMVTHPGAGNWSGTLVNALLWHWKTSALQGNHRPGIVHRLDKDTSGAIITARNPETESFLQEQFRSRKTRKLYIAILSGVPKAPVGDIRTNILRDPKNRKRFTWIDDTAKGKSARTEYRVLRVYGSYALVVFTLHTGRTHQIRVHSKFLGCPILGDPVYGKKDRLFPDATLMLHAWKLSITLPGDDIPRRFIAPVPLRFKKIIHALKGTAK